MKLRERKLHETCTAPIYRSASTAILAGRNATPTSAVQLAAGHASGGGLCGARQTGGGRGSSVLGFHTGAAAPAGCGFSCGIVITTDHGAGRARKRRQQDVTKDDMEIVSAAHRAVADRVGKERFAIWFGRGVRMETCPAGLRVAAGDSFRLEYLRRAFRADLLAAAKLVLGSEAALDFVVEQAAAQSDAPSAERDSARLANDSVPLLLNVAGSSDNSAPVDCPAPGAAAAVAGERQLPRLPRRQFAALNDFLASDDNRVALSAAQTAAARPGTYSPLTFVGPPGSGKTHLLEGIWRQVRQSRSCQRVIYLSAEQFTNQFLEALRQSGTPSFRRKYRDVELLLIDDVQFFAGKQSTIVELVHTIDTLLRDGRQLVFAADRPPLELRGLRSQRLARRV